MNSRRGACPSLLEPMPTGDGLLARLSPTAPIPIDVAIALCDLSRTNGNGIMEITRRGSLQFRGLSPRSVPDVAHAVTALGLGVQTRPPLVVSPLLGLDARGADLRALLVELRAALANSPTPTLLAPKISVLVDGGGALHLDDVPGDIRLRAGADSQLHVSMAGTATTSTSLGWIPAHRAPEAVVRLLTHISRSGPASRARDVVRPESLQVLSTSLRDILADAPPPAPRPPAQPIGIHPLNTGKVALGAATAFGYIEAETFARLLRHATAWGATSIQLSPEHVVLFIGLDADTAVELTAQASAAGLIVRPDDPRSFVIACPGAPACDSAKIAARELAPVIANTARPLLDGSSTIHVSGCPKGCAHSDAAALTFIGPNHLVIQGRAGDAPHGTATIDEFIAGIGRLNAEHRHRGPQARSIDTLSMLGVHGVLAAMGGRPMIDYVRDGTAIYEQSFATIRSEADLSRFSTVEADVAVRMIHACGMVGIAEHIVFSAGVIDAARRALHAGAAILCDSEMVSHGITRARLPAANPVICTLRDVKVPALAKELRTTRSAAALELWRQRIEGSIIAIGNAPTALFRLLEMLDEGMAKPAAILGIPVGFVGAVESKEALIADPRGVPFVALRGRMGGSAITAAAVNGLARAGL